MTENRKMPALSALDRKILNRVQRGVPLARRPFAVLADEFAITEEEMISRLSRLREAGIVRRLGPIINYQAWGMSGVLVAANVPEERIDAARAAVLDFPEITHAYLRDHAWNFWFTVVAEDEEARDAIIARVAERAGLKDVRKLKRKKSFKLNVNFRM